MDGQSYYWPRFLIRETVGLIVRTGFTCDGTHVRQAFHVKYFPFCFFNPTLLDKQTSEKTNIKKEVGGVWREVGISRIFDLCFEV